MSSIEGNLALTLAASYSGEPLEVVETQELEKYNFDGDFQAKIAATGFELDPTATPEEFAKYVDFQLKHWGEMLRNAGVKPQ